MTDSNTTPVPSGDSASGGQNPASQQPVPLQPTQPAPYSSQGTQPYGGQQAYAGQAGYGAQQSYGYGAQQTSGSAQHSAAQPYGQQTYEAEPVSMHAQHAAPKGNGGKTFLIAFAGALVACVLAFGVWGIVGAMIPDGSNSGASTVVTDPSTGETTVIAPSEDPTLAEAVSAKCLPSVAAITVYAEASQNDAMSQYFGYQYGGQGDGSGDLVAYSQGSGVVLTEDGYIITNNHVVEGGSAYEVMVAGETYEADLVGTDPSSDVAVLKAKDASGLTVMELGDSDNLTIGEWVMTLGSPFGLEQSVATGIVSATSRSQIMDAQESMQSGGTGEITIYPNMIQTDAAINPGNSGGPTFNAAGQVIGINSSIASTATSSDSAGSIGIGFAIPSNLVKRVADEIIKDGKVKHVALGVVIKSDTVEADGVTRGGATITKSSATGSAVVSGGPADKAGLKEGDTIVAFNGNAVNNNYSLLGYVRAAALGDKVTLTIVRDGKTMDVDVTLDQEESSVNGSSSSDSNGNSQNNQNNQNGNGQNGYGNGNGNSDGGTGDGGGFSDPFGLW